MAFVPRPLVRRFLSRGFLLSVVVGLVAGTGITGGTLAQAAAGAETAWGPDGTVITDSAVTAAWSNGGNSIANTVAERTDSEAPIAHAGASAYADVSKRLRDSYQKEFGSANGRGGLQMEVSQTTDLVNQAVSVDFSGAAAPPANASANSRYVQLFQCWGSSAEQAPDPEHCQTGVGSSDAPTNDVDFRSLLGDPLSAAGDLAGKPTMPFVAIDGRSIDDPGKIPYFSRTTTNELSRIPLEKTGAATRSFEIQTGQEAQGLGCGIRADTPSTSVCWVVAVPVDRDAINAAFPGGLGQGGIVPSPLSPSLWAQRLQVKLTFQPVAPVCAGGQAQTLSVGSELLTPAMASWAPGICDSRKVAAGFSTVADAQARTAVSTASADLGFVSQPVADASATLEYAPVAVSGVAIGYTLDYHSCATISPDIQVAKARCGYPDVSAAAADKARDGQLVTNLKLNARLVVKLLTQSYGIANNASLHSLNVNVPWLASYNVNSDAVPAKVPLLADPEFLDLNPGLKYNIVNTDNARRLTTEILKSDGAAQLWNWIVNDPGARSFLDGCPDPHGAVINSFYSTRSYAECKPQAAALEKAAAALRHVTLSPEDFNKSQSPSYPPTDAAYPTVLYAQEDAETIGITSQGTGTLVDLLPQVADMKAAAKAAFLVNPPVGVWCDSFSSSPCNPGLWKSSQGAGALPGLRGVFAVTDTVNAARFQVQTALLCNDSGSSCVGADTASLTKAAAKFQPTATAGVVAPAAKPDYAGGAYPLAMPVYGVVNTSGLASADAKAIANILDYASTTGQKPGVRAGNLLPGYAPLSKGMIAQTAATVTKLRQLTDAAPASISAPVSAVPLTQPVPTEPTPEQSTPTPKPFVLAEGSKTSSIEVGFPQFGLFAGLGAAVLAGALAPVLGRKRRVDRP